MFVGSWLRSADSQRGVAIGKKYCNKRKRNWDLTEKRSRDPGTRLGSGKSPKARIVILAAEDDASVMWQIVVPRVSFVCTTKTP